MAKNRGKAKRSKDKNSQPYKATLPPVEGGYLKIQEAARYMQFSRTYLVELSDRSEAENRLPCRRVGGPKRFSRRFLRADIDAWMRREDARSSRNSKTKARRGCRM